MAKKKPPQEGAKRVNNPNVMGLRPQVLEQPITETLEVNYMPYAMSVIVSRAIPEIDGFKPSHRKLLYTMYLMNLLKGDRTKSSNVVGQTMKLNPHGDATIYETLVRLTEGNGALLVPFVDSKGNFGRQYSRDMAYAAPRYTEVKLAAVCNEIFADIDKNTVDFINNYDDSMQEPTLLPTTFPNILANPNLGIAVGMATNIPPHNLREVINATICVLENPDATVSQLMEHIQGPDFPTRGIIMGRSGIRAAYATGRGKITLRARTEFEEYGKGRIRIIVSELPYQVNKRQLIKAMAEQVKDKRLDGISDIRDETDRNGMRIVIELKKDANPQVVLNKLFTQTAMQSNFSVIMLALVDDQKQPKILTLKNVLDEYIAFQEQVIRRRTQYDLRKAQERAHLLEGLLVAQDNIDEVIHIIRTSYDDAKQRLMERFSLDEVQTQAILEMQLRRLQGLDREKLEAEYKELEEKIAYYNELLASEEKLRGVLKDELIAIRDKFGDKRITEIQDVADEIDIEDLIEEEQSVFTMTANGYIKRTSASEYAAQGKGGVGRKGMTAREEDYVNTVFTASTHDYILFFTDKGRVFRKKGYQIPEAGRTAKGTSIVNVLQVEAGEKVAVMIHTRDISEGDDPRYLTMFTRKGTVKRLDASALRNLRNNGLRVITLEEGDELIEVRETDGEQNLLIATHGGMAACFPEGEVRTTGRTSMGVRGIKLREGDYVVAAARAKPGKAVLTITENGYGKRSPVEDYRITARGAYGVKNYGLTDKTGAVVGVKVVDGSEDLLLVTQSGTIIRTDVDAIRTVGRASQGVIVMRFKDEGDRVIALSLAEKEPGEPFEAEE